MICKHCRREATQHGPLGHCAQCGIWYKGPGEQVKGVYMLCATRDDNPEKCVLVVQREFERDEELPDGEETHIATAKMPNVRKADKVCVSCTYKHFVLKLSD